MCELNTRPIRANGPAFSPEGLSIYFDEQKNGARDGTRTRDNHVGNVELYQLSYSRSKLENYSLWKEKI